MRIVMTVLAFTLAGSAMAVEPKTLLDVPYAGTDNVRQTLDVFAPPEGKDRPVVVWVHGGGWQKGSKAEVKVKPQAFVDAGYVFVSINYRLLPEATIGQMAGDVAKAIRWVHDHAREFGGSPDTLFVMGHSAGAQLAALVCTDDSYLAAEKLKLNVIKGCVPVDGDTYDVPLQIKTVEQRRADIYRMKFGELESRKKLSPITHATKGKDIPPFLILHVAGHPETQLQSRNLIKALEDVGVRGKAYGAEGKNHTTINDELGVADDKPSAEMFNFLKECLKAK